MVGDDKSERRGRRGANDGSHRRSRRNCATNAGDEDQEGVGGGLLGWGSGRGKGNANAGARRPPRVCGGGLVKYALFIVLVLALDCGGGRQGVATADGVCQPQSFTAQCSGTGQYSFPGRRWKRCRPKMCNATTLSAGISFLESVEPGGMVPIRTNVTVRCLEGYRLGSQSPAAPREIQVSCLGSCTFPAVPPCVRATCDTSAYGNPPNSVSDFVFGVTTVFLGTTINITCSPGYTHVDPSSGACSRNFSVGCASSPSGRISVPGADSCVVEAEASCSRRGGAQAAAAEWGQGGGGRGRAAAATCGTDQLESEHGTRTDATPQPTMIPQGSSLTLECDSGYRSGLASVGYSSCTDATSVTHVCEAGGIFNVTSRCVPVSCGAFSSSPTGVATVMQGGSGRDVVVYGEVATVSCSTCHRAGGSARTYRRSGEAACNADCTFTPSVLDCHYLQCGEYSPPEFSSVTSSTVPVGDVLRCLDEVIMACSPGNISSQATGGTCDASLKATCNDHGTIEGSDLACLPVSCAPLSDSAFTLLTTGSSGWSPTGRLLSGESVTVSCSDGYRALAGIDHSSCTDPDQFTASCTPGTCDYDSGGTRCVQVACPLHLQAGLDPAADYPFVKYLGGLVPITCAVGYRHGTTSSTGSRSGTSTCSDTCLISPGCSLVTCVEYSPPPHASMSRGGGLITSQAVNATAVFDITVSCDEGFVVGGSVAPDCPTSFTVVCSDAGILQGHTSVCVPRPCGCPGANPCDGSQVTSCGAYVAPDNSITTQVGWTASREWTEGETVTGECAAGYVTSGRWRGGGRGNGVDACNAGFTDACEQIGRFRSFYDGPVCEELSCPVPAGPGLVVSATAGGGVGAALVYGMCVDVSCQQGYQAVVGGVPTNNASASSHFCCSGGCDTFTGFSCEIFECPPIYTQFAFSSCAKPGGGSVPWGSSVTVECNEDCELDDDENATVVDGPAILTLTGKSAAFGPVSVYASATFSPPSRTSTTSVSLSGSYSKLSFKIPASSWPASLTTGLSVSVFDLPSSIAGDKGTVLTGAGGQQFSVIGQAVDLGPEGHTFSPPIVITCPFTPGGDYSGKELRVFKYDTATSSWISIAPPSDGSSPVDLVAGTVKAETSSFSPYMAVAVTPRPTPPPSPPTLAPTPAPAQIPIPSTTPAPPPSGGLSRVAAISLGVGLGGAFLVVSAALVYRYAWRSRMGQRSGAHNKKRKDGPPLIDPPSAVVVESGGKGGSVGSKSATRVNGQRADPVAGDSERVPQKAQGEPAAPVVDVIARTASKEEAQRKKRRELDEAKIKVHGLMQEVMSVTTSPESVFRPEAQLGFVQDKRHGGDE